jgi:hypothetical protein
MPNTVGWISISMEAPRSFLSLPLGQTILIASDPTKSSPSASPPNSAVNESATASAAKISARSSVRK